MSIDLAAIKARAEKARQQCCVCSGRHPQHCCRGQHANHAGMVALVAEIERLNVIVEAGKSNDPA